MEIFFSIIHAEICLLYWYQTAKFNHKEINNSDIYKKYQYLFRNLLRSR